MDAGKPLAIDLFCGLFGWSEGLVVEGYDVVGVDLEDMCGQFGVPRPEHVHLVIQDVLTLHGSQLRNVDLIVASPPCQFFSYTAMPWSKAKALAAEVRADPGRMKQETALFDACFRLKREACEAAGRHIPLVVENVRGAIPWVGRSRWNFGSYHLWGDVPALMPPVVKRGAMKQGIAHRAGELAGGQAMGGIKGVPHRTKGHWTNPAEHEGIKQRGSGREWFAGDGKISRMTSSKSPARKFASAMIAKIPLPLSRHVAKAWHPRSEAA
jgi:hypothetical protein